MFLKYRFWKYFPQICHCVSCNARTRDCEFHIQKSHWPLSKRSVRISRMTKKPVDSLAGWLSWGSEESGEAAKLWLPLIRVYFGGRCPFPVIVANEFYRDPYETSNSWWQLLGDNTRYTKFPWRRSLKEPKFMRSNSLASLPSLHVESFTQALHIGDFFIWTMFSIVWIRCSFNFSMFCWMGCNHQVDIPR